MQNSRHFMKWFVTGTKAWLTLAPGSRPRREARGIIIATYRITAKYPRLYQLAERVLVHFPSARFRLKRIVTSNEDVSSIDYFKQSHLSPRAQEIYNDLIQAISNLEEEKKP
jgi:O-antigen chain-terminating methyltransferase